MLKTIAIERVRARILRTLFGRRLVTDLALKLAEKLSRLAASAVPIG